MSPVRLATELISLFPPLARELQAEPTRTSLTAQLTCLAAYTHEASRLEQEGLVARCFLVADRLLGKADKALTAAFRKAYFPGLRLDALPNGERLARQLMPTTLFGRYVRHQYVATHR